MKSHLIASLFLSSFAMIAVACGAPTPEDPAVGDDEGSIGEASSALMTLHCGTTYVCGENEHPMWYGCKSECGSCVGTTPAANAVYCDTNSSYFHQCGLDCPDGYHSWALKTTTSCPSTGGPWNQAVCDTNNQNDFGTCEQFCPAGFAETVRYCSSLCGSCESGNNSVGCHRVYS